MVEDELHLIGQGMFTWGSPSFYENAQRKSTSSLSQKGILVTQLPEIGWQEAAPLRAAIPIYLQTAFWNDREGVKAMVSYSEGLSDENFIESVVDEIKVVGEQAVGEFLSSKTPTGL